MTKENVAKRLSFHQPWLPLLCVALLCLPACGADESAPAVVTGANERMRVPDERPDEPKSKEWPEHGERAARRPSKRDCARCEPPHNGPCGGPGSGEESALAAALEPVLEKLQNRQLALQNDDGGWDFFAESADNLRDKSDSSPLNAFGAPALGLLAAYDLTLEPDALLATQRVAEVLLTRPIARKARLFTTDELFLLEAAKLLGPPAYAETAALSHAAEKDYAAALAILGTPDPTAEQVDALSQAQLDAVPPSERVAALAGRLVWSGRGPGLRLYDWGYRLQAAEALGDVAYADAIAAKMAQDHGELSIDQPLYLLGLAWTVVALGERASSDPAYGLLVGDALQQLLAQQQPNGLFYVDPVEGSEGGTVQEQAFIVQALRLAGAVDPLRDLLSALLAQQLPSGAFPELGGGESVFAQGELLAAFGHVLKDKVLLAALCQPRKRPRPPCAPNEQREGRPMMERSGVLRLANVARPQALLASGTL